MSEYTHSVVVDYFILFIQSRVQIQVIVIYIHIIY